MVLANKRSKPVFDPNKPFAWSYSKIKNFKTCPRRHYEVDILKNYVEYSKEIEYGVKVHDALADAIGNKGNKIPENPNPPVKPIPDEFSELNPYPGQYTRMRAAGALVASEMDLAITRSFTPTSWFGKDAWFRAKVDVIAISNRGAGPVAVAVDWKTGKVVEDSPQLQMTALAVFAHFPNVQLVNARFEWMKSDDRTDEKVRREDQPRVWNAIHPQVMALEAAYTNPNPDVGFPAKPGFLCRQYCPVRTCPHHGGR